MTKSVANNSLIEEQIENTLSSSHILFHLLCVSHTCEIFLKGIISVLCDTERKMGLAELLISLLPVSKSFLFKYQSVTMAVIKTLTKLATIYGHKSSFYEQFENEQQVTVKSRKYGGFKEQRFTLMGYTTAELQSFTIWKSLKLF